MKKSLATMGLLFLLLFLVACGDAAEEDASSAESVEEEEIDEAESNESDTDSEDGASEEDVSEVVEEASADQIDSDQPSDESPGIGGTTQKSVNAPDLTLQVQNVDAEAGVTVENNEIYRQLNQSVRAEPKAGYPNDFTIYPHDIVYHQDGSSSVLFLAVNRLDTPVKNIYLEISLGNRETGEYIYESAEVMLDEEQVGTIETDSAMPFLVDISPEDEEIFFGLTETTADVQINDYDFELIEE